MADRIYVGSGKEKTFPDGGSSISVSLTLDGIKEYFEKYGFTTEKGKHILKLKIGRRREVGKYGETHTVEVDTWKPEQTRQSVPTVKQDQDDIPF